MSTGPLSTPLKYVAWRMFWRNPTNVDGGWTQVLAQSGGNRTNFDRPMPAGMNLMRFSRCLFPSLGSADFYWEFGDINGLQFQPSGSQEYTIGSVPDLLHKEVRIDVTYFGDELRYPDEDGWTTAFWGIVEAQNDTITPASVFTQQDDIEEGFVPAGRREYRAYDLTSAWAKRYVHQHSFQPISGSARENCRGPMAYNRTMRNDLAAPESYGNRAAAKITGANGQQYYPHTVPQAGSSAAFTDADTVENVIVANSVAGDWQITVTDGSSLLTGKNVWKFPEGMPVRDAVAMVLDRRRGRGAAYFDWTDSDDGPTNPTLNIVPQTLDDIDYGIGTQDGAETAGTSVNVSLTGDHRVVTSGFQLGGTSAFTADYVETVGEPIEVLCCLSYPDGSLEKRWSAAKETSVDDAADVPEAELANLQHVYRRHGIPADWSGAAGNGNGDGQDYRIDYYCTDAGTPTGPSQAGGDQPSFSPLTVELLPDCPCMSGTDPATGTLTDDTAASRGVDRLPIAAFHKTADNEFVQVGSSATTSMQEQCIFSTDGDDKGNARFGSSDNFPYTGLAFRVGVRLANRIRMATGSPTGNRRVQVYVEGAHLWIGHEGAMVGIDDDSTAQVLGEVKYYRNDIARIKRQHALAEAWYLRSRRALAWQIRDCGFTAADPNDDAAWPSIGQVVDELDAASQTWDIATPISMVEYDHQTGTTTWRTDWVELG